MVNNTYQITTRTVGALQMTGGALGVGASVAASPIACATGIGCVADAGLIILSADSAYTGSKQLVTGIPQNTIFNKALQGLGLSPQAAAYLEAVVGVGTTVVASSPAIQKAITSALSPIAANSSVAAETQATLTQQVADLRATLAGSAKTSGNMGVAQIDIPGIQSTMSASSRVAVPSAEQQALGFVGEVPETFPSSVVPTGGGPAIGRAQINGRHGSTF